MALFKRKKLKKSKTDQEVDQLLLDFDRENPEVSKKIGSKAEKKKERFLQKKQTNLKKSNGESRRKKGRGSDQTNIKLQQRTKKGAKNEHVRARIRKKKYVHKLLEKKLLAKVAPKKINKHMLVPISHMPETIRADNKSIIEINSNPTLDKIKNKGSKLLLEDITKRKLFVVEKRFEKNRLSTLAKKLSHSIWFDFSQIQNNVTYRSASFMLVGIIVFIIVIISVIVGASVIHIHHNHKTHYPKNFVKYLAASNYFLNFDHNTISFNLPIHKLVYVTYDVEYIDYVRHSDTNYDFSFYTIFVNIANQQVLNHRFLITVNDHDNYVQVIDGHDYTNDSIFANINSDWQQCTADMKTLPTDDPINVAPNWVPPTDGYALFPAKKDLRIVIEYLSIASPVAYTYLFRADLDLDIVTEEKKRQFNVAHGILTYVVHHINGYNSDYNWTDVAPY